MGCYYDQEWNIMNDAFGCSRVTQVHMEIPETVNLTEFHPRYTSKQRNLLVNALDGCTHESIIKLKITDENYLQHHNDSTTKLARTGST